MHPRERIIRDQIPCAVNGVTQEVEKHTIKPPDLQDRELETLTMNIFMTIDTIKYQHQETIEEFDKLIKHLRIYFEKYPPGI